MTVYVIGTWGSNTYNCLYTVLGESGGATYIGRYMEDQERGYLQGAGSSWWGPYNCVKHEEIIKILEQINIDGNNLQIIKKIYRQQQSSIG